MISYAVIFSPEAEAQLEELNEYIAARSGAGRASHFTGEIIDACRSLATFPERCRKRDELRPHLYVMGCSRNVNICFAIKKEAAMVIIIGIFYGGQDFEAALCDDENS